jgi:hypothetical protein
MLNMLATAPRCSYLGRESTQELEDGTTLIKDVELIDVCLTAAPFFAETGAWRSDTQDYDLPPDLRRLRWKFQAGTREPLPDLVKASAQRPSAVAPTQVRALVRGIAPGGTTHRRTAGGMTRAEWRALMGNQQLADALWDLQETSRHEWPQR